MNIYFGIQLHVNMYFIQFILSHPWGKKNSSLKTVLPFVAIFYLTYMIRYIP